MITKQMKVSHIGDAVAYIPKLYLAIREISQKREVGKPVFSDRVFLDNCLAIVLADNMNGTNNKELSIGAFLSAHDDLSGEWKKFLSLLGVTNYTQVNCLPLVQKLRVFLDALQIELRHNKTTDICYITCNPSSSKVFRINQVVVTGKEYATEDEVLTLYNAIIDYYSEEVEVNKTTENCERISSILRNEYSPYFPHNNGLVINNYLNMLRDVVVGQNLYNNSSLKVKRFIDTSLTLTNDNNTILNSAELDKAITGAMLNFLYFTIGLSLEKNPTVTYQKMRSCKLVFNVADFNNDYIIKLSKKGSKVLKGKFNRNNIMPIYTLQENIISLLKILITKQEV